MKMDTKERILVESLKLFAKNGYEAVSVADIAGQIGMTKGALYKHYKNKRDILDSILRRMEEQDATMADQYHVPAHVKELVPQQYRDTSIEDFVRFTVMMFDYWTKDAFAGEFRKMLTIEQYKSKEMQELYQNYLGSGVIGYIGDVMEDTEWKGKELEYWGVFYLLLNQYDVAEDKEKVREQLREYLSSFLR